MALLTPACLRCRCFIAASAAVRDPPLAPAAITTSAYIHIPSVTPLRHTSQPPSMLAACIAQISTTYITSTTLPHYPTPAPYHATPIHHISPHHHTPIRNTPIQRYFAFLLLYFTTPRICSSSFLSFFFLCALFLIFFQRVRAVGPPHPSISISIVWLSRIAFRAAAHALCAHACLLLTATPIHLSCTGRAATGASCNTVLILISNRFFPLVSFCVSISISVSVFSISVCVCVCVCLSVNCLCFVQYIIFGAPYNMGARFMACVG